MRYLLTFALLLVSLSVPFSAAIAQSADSLFQIGLRGVPNSLLGFMLTDEQRHHYNVEVFGRIPVRGVMSINVGGGYASFGNSARDQPFEGERGPFFKAGLYRAFRSGFRRRAHVFIGLNYVLSRVEARNDIEIFNPFWNSGQRAFLEDEKNHHSLEVEWGFEVRLKHNIYLGSSMVLNGPIDRRSQSPVNGSLLDNVLFSNIPGLTGLFEQEHFIYNLLNVSWRFGRRANEF